MEVLTLTSQKVIFDANVMKIGTVLYEKSQVTTIVTK